jgi:hypothetical protein
MLLTTRSSPLLQALSYASLLLGVCQAQSLTGIVYYNNSGPSGKGVGQIDLVVGEKLWELQYRKPLRLGRPICRDVGAIWTVVVEPRSRSGDWISSATCEGKAEELVHGPWLVVRQYLDRLAAESIASSTQLLSSRWQASPEFEQYAKGTDTLDLSKYGQCLQARPVQPSDQARVHAGIECYLSRQGRPVELSFDVLRNPTLQRWEIDRIGIQ